jgi:hypothetical protein
VQSRKLVKGVLPNTLRSKALREPLPERTREEKLSRWLAQIVLPTFFSREPRVPKEPPELSVLMAFANASTLENARHVFARWLQLGPGLELGPAPPAVLDALDADWPTLDGFVQDARAGLTMLAHNHPGRPIKFPWHLVSKWDLSRIRNCEVCQKFFYATRSNRLTCSKKCAGTRRQREFRKHRQDYEQQRKLKGAKR